MHSTAMPISSSSTLSGLLPSMGPISGAVLIAAVSCLVFAVWIKGQRAALTRRRAREQWLRAAVQDPPASEPFGFETETDGGLLAEASTTEEPGRVPVPGDDPLRPDATEVARAGDVLDVLGNFSASVASDFGNQFTTILGNLELIAEGVARDPELVERLEHVRAAAIDGQRATKQLLAFSSSGLRRTEQQELAPFVRGVCEQAARRSGTEIQVHVSPCARALEGNRDELAVALDCLLQNALQASDDGEVMVRCEAVREEEEGLPVPGPLIRIAVLDDGPGLPPGTGTSVFHSGFSTRTGSRGLGLSVANTLAARNGGYLQLRDARASGASTRGVLAELYVKQAEAAFGRQPSASPSAADRDGPPCVLLVEDEDGVRELLQTVLERAGMRVHSATTGPDALALARTYLGSIDLLLTDVTLPGIDGITVSERVYELDPTLPVVYMSGVIEGVELRNQLLGTTPYFVQKPFTIDEMLSTVRSALAESTANVRPRVLVVDDEPTTRRLVRALVEGEGFECVVASNGKEALDHLRATRFDVVLTDIVMPVLDGLDLCRAVQDEFPHVRLLAMSGNQAGQASLKAAPRFGAECVLKKPFSRDELALALRPSSDDEDGRVVA